MPFAILFCTLLFSLWFFSVKANIAHVERLTGNGTEQSPLHIEFVSTGFFGYDHHEPTSLSYNAPAVTTGLQRLRQLYPQHRWTSTFITDPQSPSCPFMPGNVYFMLSQWYYSRRNSSRLSIIVTPACTEGSPMNEFAGAHNILLITSAAADLEIRDRQRSPTWLSTTPFASANAVFCSLLNNLNWTTVFASLDSQEKVVMYHAYAFMRVTTKLTDCGVLFTASKTSYSDDASVRQTLGEFNSKSRVFLYFGQPLGLRILLLAATELGMTKGDHAYLAVVPWSSPAFGYFTWQLNADDDEKVKEAYRSVLLLSLVDEEQYGSQSVRNLAQEWVNISRTAYNNTELPSELAVIEALARNGGLAVGDNGKMLADSIRNRTYPDLQAGLWRISSIGVVLHNIQLASFDWEDGQLKVFMKATEMDLRVQGRETYIWRKTTSKPIWHGRNVLPPAVPVCGLDGAACYSGNHRWIAQAAGSSAAVLVALTGIIGVFAQKFQVQRAVWWILEPQTLSTRNGKASINGSRV
ncbi:hypothetical protein BV898_01192 [Hypsibius exemplaris]|uniref:Receptor ligand binding region domain-containing protein n=1 Tax=Hypsibius exemplaris TaxID=2072580 RepID=A0A1W0XC00_HYPEX|nr:hypothetical protein BV898_01192 [Hypsibius exemplaris]